MFPHFNQSARKSNKLKLKLTNLKGKWIKRWMNKPGELKDSLRH